MQVHTDIPGLRIATNVSGDDQESTFMNATLQGTRDRKFDFSIATHVEIPDDVAARGEEAIATHLDNVLGSRLGDGVKFDVQVGISTLGLGVATVPPNEEHEPNEYTQSRAIVDEPLEVTAHNDEAGSSHEGS